MIKVGVFLRKGHTFNVITMWLRGEWHCLAVSTEDCHSKGRGFEPRPFQIFLSQTLFEQLPDETIQSINQSIKSIKLSTPSMVQHGEKNIFLLALHSFSINQYET